MAIMKTNHFTIVENNFSKDYFKRFIANMIVQYPLLYCYHNYYSSEIAVLDHIFFVVGNGFDWDQNSGYPLVDADSGKIKSSYKNIDIDKFFKMKHTMKMINIDNFMGQNTSTLNLIKENKINLSDCKIKQYSNKRVVYYYCDHPIVQKWNDIANAENKKNMEFDRQRTYYYQVIRKFEDVPNKVGIDLYPITEHSKIYEMAFKGDEITYNIDTLYYGLRIVNFALEYYRQKEQRAKSKHTSQQFELLNDIKYQLTKDVVDENPNPNKLSQHLSWFPND